MKRKYFLCLFLLFVFFLTSCSLNGLTGDKDRTDSDLRQTGEAAGNSDREPGSETGASDPEDTEIDLTVMAKEASGDSTAAGSASEPTDRSGDRTPVRMELKLYFADRKAVEDGKPGPYGFVTPVTRQIPATSGILTEAINELIKGPLSEEEKVDPVMPDTAEVRKVSIQDGIAQIDFNQAFAQDHKGGTQGGSITRQSIVFTAAQFDSVDGVLVTVEGEPWSDGHFIWDTPIYADELTKTFAEKTE